MRAVVASYLELPYEWTPEISGLSDAATFWSRLESLAAAARLHDGDV